VAPNDALCFSAPTFSRQVKKHIGLEAVRRHPVAFLARASQRQQGKNMPRKLFLGFLALVVWPLWPSFALRTQLLRQPRRRASTRRLKSPIRTPWDTPTAANTTTVAAAATRLPASTAPMTALLPLSPRDISALLTYGFSDRQAHALLQKLPPLSPGSANAPGWLSETARAQLLLRDLETAGLTKEQVS